MKQLSFQLVLLFIFLTGVQPIWAQSPMMFEVLPPQAIFKINNIMQTQRIFTLDNQFLQLSEDKKNLEIVQFSRVESIPLPEEAQRIVGLSNGFVHIKLNTKKVLFIHLPTRKVHIFPMGEHGVTFGPIVFNYTLIKNTTTYSLLNGVNGEVINVGEGEEGSTSYGTNPAFDGMILRVSSKAYYIDRTTKSIHPIEFYDKSLKQMVRDWQCYSNESPTTSICQSEKLKNKIYILWDGYKLHYLDISNQSLLYENEAQKYVVLVPKIDTEKIQNLKIDQILIKNVLTGKENIIKMHVLDPTKQLKAFFTTTKDNIYFWFNNFELKVVNRNDFDVHFNKKPLSLLFNKAKKLGTARNYTQINQLIETNETFGTWDNQYKSGQWVIKANDKLMSYYHEKSPSSVKKVLLDQYYQLITTDNPDFVFLKTHSGQGFTILYDLVAQKGYEIGFSGHQFNNVMGDENYLSLTNSRDEQMLVSLTALRQKPIWRNNLIEAGYREELSKEELLSCDSKRTEHSISTQLIELRKNSDKISEYELQLLLKYRLNQSELQLLAHVMQKWLANDVNKAILGFHRLQLYERLIEAKELFSINPCLSDVEKNNLQNQIENLFQTKYDEYTPITFYSFEYFLPLQAFFKQMGKTTENDIDVLATKLAKSAEQHPQLNKIFYSKLYYFSKAILSPLIGKQFKFKTDLTHSQDKKITNLVLLSTRPVSMQNVKRNLFGFYHGFVRSLELRNQVGATEQHSIVWGADNNKFTAQVKLTNEGDLGHVVPKENGPDYIDLKKDKKFVGLMVVGSNMSGVQVGITASSYKSLYRNLGYTFEKEYGVKAYDFIKSKIASGEVDYFIKEAHSDGDEKNLFRVTDEVEVAVGKKKSSDGIDHIIYILAPFLDTNGNVQSYSTKLISNIEFGDWIRERERKSVSRLIFFNTSCSSYSKALNEITAAKSKHLINIAAEGSVSIFFYHDANPTAILLTGIHEGKNWATIKALIAPYIDSKSQSDSFLFPDSEEFDAKIRSSLGYSVNVEFQLFNHGTNRYFNVDEFNAD